MNFFLTSSILWTLKTAITELQVSNEHSMNMRQIICVAKMFVITSRTCVVSPPQKCVANLHDTAAIVNKIYSKVIFRLALGKYEEIP